MTTCWYEYVWLHFARSAWLICASLSRSGLWSLRTLQYITVSNTQTMLQYHSNQFFSLHFNYQQFSIFFSVRHIHQDANAHGNVFMCEHFMLANICKYLLFMSVCTCACTACLPFCEVVWWQKWLLSRMVSHRCTEWKENNYSNAIDDVFSKEEEKKCSDPSSQERKEGVEKTGTHMTRRKKKQVIFCDLSGLKPQ